MTVARKNDLALFVMTILLLLAIAVNKFENAQITVALSALNMAMLIMTGQFGKRGHHKLKWSAAVVAAVSVVLAVISAAVTAFTLHETAITTICIIAVVTTIFPYVNKEVASI